MHRDACWPVTPRANQALVRTGPQRDLSDSVAIASLAKTPIGLFVEEKKKAPEIIFCSTDRNAGAILSAYLGVVEVLDQFGRSLFGAQK